MKPYGILEGNAVIYCMCEERICTFTKRIEVRGDQLVMIPGGYDADRCLRDQNLLFKQLDDYMEESNDNPR